MASLADALLPPEPRAAPRPSGSNTANIAAAVISANTNHKFIEAKPRKPVPRGALSMRRFTRKPPSAAIDNSQFHGIAGRDGNTSCFNWLADREISAAG